jgi:hypothetical protein
MLFITGRRSQPRRPLLTEYVEDQESVVHGNHSFSIADHNLSDGDCGATMILMKNSGKDLLKVLQIGETKIHSELRQKQIEKYAFAPVNLICVPSSLVAIFQNTQQLRWRMLVLYARNLSWTTIVEEYCNIVFIQSNLKEAAKEMLMGRH